MQGKEDRIVAEMEFSHVGTSLEEEAMAGRVCL